MLIGGSALGYSRFQQNARDTRRKSDLEQIRAAMELFRSNTINGSYPRAAWFQTDMQPYLNPLPKDPKTGSDYFYDALPNTWPLGPCDNVTKFCTSYRLYADLELVAGQNDCMVTPLIPIPQC